MLANKAQIPADHAVISLHPDLEILPFDTATQGDAFLIEVGERRFTANSRFVKLLRCIDGQHSLAELRERFTQVTGSPYSIETVRTFIQQELATRGLLSGSESNMIPQQKSQLTVKYELLRPAAVNAIASLLKYFFHPMILFPLMLLSGMNLLIYYTSVMKPSYIDPDLIFSKNFLIFAAAMNLLTLWHEFGHAAALRYFGSRSSGIGLGLHLFMVVFYADVSAAWRLSRLQRIAVNLGGIYFEMIAMNVVFVLYQWFPLRELLLLIFFLNLRMVFNLLPFLRMDGYWLMSDWMGVPNLHATTRDFLKAVGRKFIGIRRTHWPRSISTLNPKNRFLLALYTSASLAFSIYFHYKVQVLAYSNARMLYQSLKGALVSGISWSWDFHTLFNRIGQLLLILFAIRTLFQWLTTLLQTFFQRAPS